MMNIWLVKISEPLPLKCGVRKMRAAILAETLVKRGHSIYWWASAFEHQRKTMLADTDREISLSNQYTIRSLKALGYKKNFSIQRYIDHLVVARNFRKEAVKMPKPDIIVASMPDHHLAYEASRYAKKNKIPYIMDILDPWPDIFLNLLPNKFLVAIGRVALSWDYFRLKAALEGADGIIGVSEGFLKWALNKIDRRVNDFDRVFYLGYKDSDPTELKYKEADNPSWLVKCQGKKLIIFIGTFGRTYEIELIVKTAKKFNESGRDDIYFVLAGTGVKANDIQKQAGNLPNVVLPGWIEQKDISLLLKSAWAGIVPCNSANDTVPNKPFEYMSVGLPLFSSLEGETADLIEKYHLGFNYSPGDLSGLYRSIEKLLDNTDLYTEMSSNALKFFKEYGNAERIYTDYAEHIENIAAKHP